MSRISKLEDIRVNAPDTWLGKTFLTFDLDWCSDDVLAHTLSFLEQQQVPATFFVTHETPLLDRIRANPDFELGIHPNFNPLIQGDPAYGATYEEVIDWFRRLVPEATSVRSHSLVTGSNICAALARKGFHQECSDFVPANAKVLLKPWETCIPGMVKIPYHWEDDVHFLSGWSYDPAHYLHDEQINVFDFHPIHVFLNSCSEGPYSAVKQQLQNTDVLRNHIEPGYGTWHFLQDLVALCR